MNKKNSQVDTKPQIYTRKDHIISRRNIDQDALKIMYRLNRYGYKAYLVGGGVRDLLLNKSPKDFDIATDATPRQIKGLFRNSRIIGRRFKLIHVFFRGGKIIEVSTFRDIHEEDTSEESDQITRDNIYGTESTDAFRRDLTINGLFYSSDDFSIIDYVGGIDDLNDKVVKMIGEPEVRLPEDPVRLIRVVRHAIKADFSIEPKLEKSLKKHSDLILNSAPMRVYEELRKDFSSGHSLEILKGLKKYSILQHLLPELCENSKTLSPKSALSKALSKIDILFDSESIDVSTTAFLSVLTFLHSCDPSLDISDPEIFPNKEEILKLAQRSFKGLAIPRKERERIEKTILLWKSVTESPFEKLKANTLATRAAITDLSIIFTALYTEINPDLCSLLEKATKIRKTRSKNKGSRKRRGPRPNNPKRKTKKKSHSRRRR